VTKSSTNQIKEAVSDVKGQWNFVDFCFFETIKTRNVSLPNSHAPPHISKISADTSCESNTQYGEPNCNLFVYTTIYQSIQAVTPTIIDTATHL